MTYRFATLEDISLLAEMNERLIRDENHKDRQTNAVLRSRMAEWFAEGYRAVIFEMDRQIAGYALFTKTPEHIYLKHFFIEAEHRRQGTGRTAMQWLMKNAWDGESRIRLDVLSGNERGFAFWKSLGFESYCITMERGLVD